MDAQSAIEAGEPLKALDIFVAAGVEPPIALLVACTDWLNENKSQAGIWTVFWNEYRPRFVVRKRNIQS